jgi:hypothetical protein
MQTDPHSLFDGLSRRELLQAPGVAAALRPASASGQGQCGGAKAGTPAELTKRRLNAREDTGGRGDIHTAACKSYHTTTPNGFDLQISATTKASRGA